MRPWVVLLLVAAGVVAALVVYGLAVTIWEVLAGDDPEEMRREIERRQASINEDYRAYRYRQLKGRRDK